MKYYCENFHSYVIKFKRWRIFSLCLRSVDTRKSHPQTKQCADRSEFQPQTDYIFRAFESYQMADSYKRCCIPLNFKHRKKFDTRDNLLHGKLYEKCIRRVFASRGCLQRVRCCVIDQKYSTKPEDSIDPCVEFIQLEEDYNLVSVEHFTGVSKVLKVFVTETVVSLFQTENYWIPKK